MVVRGTSWLLMGITFALGSLATPRLASAGEPSLAGTDVLGGCGATSRPCQCSSGAWGTQTCDKTGLFTLCACGAANLDLGSGWKVPNIHLDRPKQPKKVRKRPSGVGLLIGGLITLGLGATSLGIGVTLIREDEVVPLGVVLTATGGTAMVVGLPLSAVGLYYVTTKGDSRGHYQGELAPSFRLGPAAFGAGPGGVSLRF